MTRICQYCKKSTLTQTAMFKYFVGAKLRCSACTAVLAPHRNGYALFAIASTMATVLLLVGLGNVFGFAGMVAAFALPGLAHLTVPWWFPLEVTKAGQLP